MRMNSRERVLTAIRHEQPDRLPVDLWAEPQVWDRLLKDLGCSTRDEVLNVLDVDVRYIEPIYPADTIREGVRQNMWGERWAMATTVFGTAWEHIDGVLAGAGTLADLEAFPWPTCDDVDYSTIAEQCRRYEGKAIAFGNADIFERPALVRGFENMLCDTGEHPEWVDYLVKVFVDFYVEDFTRCLEAAQGKIDIYWALTDLGTQQGLIMSRGTFNRFIAPTLRTLSALAHRHGVKFMFHSCGAVRELIPDLIATGVDILNPIQPAAFGMAPDTLKADFGAQLCFHGGVDIQYLLPLEKPAKVREEVRERGQILGKNGGYILAPSHNLQPDISTENIRAMYELSLRQEGAGL